MLWQYIVSCVMPIKHIWIWIWGRDRGGCNTTFHTCHRPLPASLLTFLSQHHKRQHLHTTNIIQPLPIPPHKTLYTAIAYHITSRHHIAVATGTATSVFLNCCSEAYITDDIVIVLCIFYISRWIYTNIALLFTGSLKLEVILIYWSSFWMCSLFWINMQWKSLAESLTLFDQTLFDTTQQKLTDTNTHEAAHD